MAGHGKERAPEDARPERVGARQIETEVEEVYRLARRGVGRERARQPARHAREEEPEGEQRAREVDEDLDQIDPDDRLDASQERVERRRSGENQDRCPDRDPEDQGDRDRRHGQPHGGRHDARDHEEQRREAPRGNAKPRLEQRIGGREFSFEVARQKQKRNGDPPEDVAEDQLQEREPAAVGVAGNGKEGQSGGLRRHDRAHHSPPGHRMVSQEVVARVFLVSPDPRAQQVDAGEIDENQEEGRESQAQGFHLFGLSLA